jgi:hypothetical protein
MNCTDIVNQLAGVLQSPSTVAAQIAASATQATQQLKAGQLTQDEYKEIIGDLQTQQLVNIEAQFLVVKEELDQLFNLISQATSIFPL